MINLLLVLILLIGIANSAYAANIGIVVEFNDGIKTDCVNVLDGSDGFEILENSLFDVLWSPASSFGQLVCKINNEGTEIQGNFCQFSGEFWNFNILSYGSNEWLHSPVGHNGLVGCWNRKVTSFIGHYCGVNKDVIGYDFGSAAEPPLMSYEQVCEKLKLKDIKVFVGGKKETGADEDGGKIDVIPGSKLELKIELENLYTENEDIEIEDITVEGTLEDIDSGNDIEDSVSSFDLKAQKDKKVALEFNIPDQVDDEDYELIIEIEGENERGFTYSKTIEFEVEVEMVKEEVVFEESFLGNDIQCIPSLNVKCNSSNNSSNYVKTYERSEYEIKPNQEIAKEIVIKAQDHGNKEEGSNVFLKENNYLIENLLVLGIAVSEIMLLIFGVFLLIYMLKR